MVRPQPRSRSGVAGVHGVQYRASSADIYPDLRRSRFAQAIPLAVDSRTDLSVLFSHVGGLDIHRRWGDGQRSDADQLDLADLGPVAFRNATLWLYAHLRSTQPSTAEDRCPHGSLPLPHLVHLHHAGGRVATGSALQSSRLSRFRRRFVVHTFHKDDYRIFGLCGCDCRNDFQD